MEPTSKELTQISKLADEVRQRLASIYAESGKKYAYIMALVQEGETEEEVVSFVTNQVANRSDLLSLLENVLLSAEALVEGEKDQEAIVLIRALFSCFHASTEQMGFAREGERGEEEEEEGKKGYLQ